MKKSLLGSIVFLGIVLFVGCATSKVNMEKILSTVGINGIPLPYSVLRNDLIDVNTNQAFEIRNGGFGSDMVAHPSKSNEFYALTDRGANANFTGEQGKGKMFPTPNYVPRIGHFRLTEKGSIELIKEILLKREDGTPISGLPNSSALGGTGETPYDANGNVIRLDMSKPFDEKTNPIKLDDYGLDGEGLVALSDGSFWVSDEYGPHIVHFDKNGVEIDRINAFATDKRSNLKLPTEFTNRRANRGMEGLAASVDEKMLVGIMQSTMHNPSSKVKNLNLTRIVTVDLETGNIGQYIYKQEKNQNSNSGIVAISEGKFFLIERDGAFLKGGPLEANPKAQKHIYEIDIRTGTNLEDIKDNGVLMQNSSLGLTIEGKTLEEYVFENGWNALQQHNIKPVSKRIIADMVKKVQYPHDKMEGLWVIDNKHIGVINDDDFATWSTAGKLHSKTLGNGKIDSNILYIIDIE